ncbi:GAF and ANTAR domain-containing protein [Streptomyces sp. NPDC127108]|uniref:GAF and ANTAR domain-containing protein n=1 Tax=Streptomyces sp. NPDC127108 TaxID=3345361 RepID=UPI00363CA5A0
MGGSAPPGGSLDSLLDRVARAAGTALGLRAVPTGLVRLLGLDALTLSAITSNDLPELVWSEPPEGLGPALEELQFAVGDGPTLEVARQGCLLAEPDLTVTDPARWPAFLPVAARTSVRAVTAVPLLLGIATVGVLTGYRTTVGAPTGADLRDLKRLSRALLPLLLDPTGAILADESGPRPDLVLHRAEVHQATGYLAGGLGLSPYQAFLKLRSYATAHGVPLTALARALLSGHLLPDVLDH